MDFKTEAIKLISSLLAEAKCLGKDLQEINDGERTVPTALLDPELVERAEKFIYESQAE